jgi:hypothetical protein
MAAFLEDIPDIDAVGFDAFGVFSLRSLLRSKILQVLADMELAVEIGGS